MIDPANEVDAEMDVAMENRRITAVSADLAFERGDIVHGVRGLQVWPGFMNMHMHLGDLFETGSVPIFESVADEVTVALSPGGAHPSPVSFFVSRAEPRRTRR